MSGFCPLLKAGRGGITSAKLTREWGPGAALSIKAEVSHLGAPDKPPEGQPPHFSVTCEVVTTESRRQRDIAGGGCLHELAVEYMPEIAPIVALHLSHATDGAPMHSLENGWYWLSGALGGLGKRYHGGNGTPARSPEDCLRGFAEYCRIGLDEARSVSQRLASETDVTRHQPCEKCGGPGIHENGFPCETCKGSGLETLRHFMRRRWAEECNDMRPRWAREARAGLALMWSLAGPADLRPEWAKRLRDVMGVHVADLAAEIQPARGTE